jgi:large subunit ribosomal protein L10e
MRGAFGKPIGKVARVNIGQIVMSVRSKDASQNHVIEAIRRASFKFPGRMKIFVSKKWGFTDLFREEYVALKEEGKLKTLGSHAKKIRTIGPLGQETV